MLSYFVPMINGKAVEVGMVGREAASALSTLFGARPPSRHVSVTISGRALRVSVECLGPEFEQSVGLRSLLTKSAGKFIAQVMERPACGLLQTGA